MPNPDRRIGTKLIVSGVRVLVVYSKPKGVESVGPGTATVLAARASQPRRSEISCTSVLTSFTLVDLDRSCESLPSRQGWVETCTLGGRDMLAVGYGEIRFGGVSRDIWAGLGH